MNSLLPPPRLTRTYAVADAVVSPPPEAEALIRQVLTAYTNLPFKGQAVALPGDAVVAEDLWRCKLEDHLEELWSQGAEAHRLFTCLSLP